MLGICLELSAKFLAPVNEGDDDNDIDITTEDICPICGKGDVMSSDEDTSC